MSNTILDIILQGRPLVTTETGQATARVDQARPPSSIQNEPQNNVWQEAGATDQASLSTEAVWLGRAVTTLRNVTSFRPELVAKIRSALENGSYSPDINEVAAAVAKALKST